MDRRPVTRGLTAVGAAALLALTLLTCSNPIDIVGVVQTEVMVSNNKFLLASQTGPFQPNEIGVSPGTNVWIKFDRDLDESSITPAAVVFSPAAAWVSSSYNSTTHTLTVQPGFLESLTPYTVTIGAGLKGTDGSTLQANVTISFTTKQAPSGTMTINTGSAYTNVNPATLTYTYSASTTEIRWSIVESEITDNAYTGNTTAWTGKTPTVSGFALGGDGSRTIYYQFRDALDNVTPGYNLGAGTHPLSASVVVDTAAPTVNSFSINSGATYAASTAVTLYNNVTDATSPIEMHFLNYGGVWSDTDWVPYSATKAWPLRAAGTRQVSAQFRDAAGNVSLTQLSDTIIAAAPAMLTYMNYHPYQPVGNMYIWWSLVAPDVGADTYHISYRYHYPSPGPWISYTTTPNTSLPYFATGKEVILDWAVQIENTSVGAFNAGAAPFSNAAPNFTSDVAVIYNDKDATDTALASTIQGVLKNSGPWFTGSSYYGSFPTWSVTLIPESFISTTFSNYNRIWAYPLILTPGVTGYENAYWLKNLVVPGKGMIFMGEGGARAIDSTNYNWGKVLYPKGNSEQPPTDIGYANSDPKEASAYFYSKTTGNTVWSSPIYYSMIYPDHTLYSLTYAALPRLSVIRKDGSAPRGGDLYSADYPAPNDSLYFNTVRQGRFLQFGYYGLPNRVQYAYPWFVNLVYRMGEANFP